MKLQGEGKKSIPYLKKQLEQANSHRRKDCGVNNGEESRSAENWGWDRGREEAAKVGSPCDSLLRVRTATRL